MQPQSALMSTLAMYETWDSGISELMYPYCLIVLNINHVGRTLLLALPRKQNGYTLYMCYIHYRWV